MAIFGKKQAKSSGSGGETRWVRLGPDCDVLRLFMEKDQNRVPWTSPAFRAYTAHISKMPLEFLVPPKERLEARIVYVSAGGRASMHGFHMVLQTGGRENLRRLTGIEGVNADHFTPQMIQDAQAAGKARATGRTQPPAATTQPPAARTPVVSHTPTPKPVASMQPPGVATSKPADLDDFGEFSESSVDTGPPPAPADVGEYLGGDIGEMGPTEEEFQSYMAGGRAPGDELPDKPDAFAADEVEEAELVDLDEAEELGAPGEDLGTAPDLAASSDYLAPESEDHPFAEEGDSSPFDEGESNPFDDDGGADNLGAADEFGEPVEDAGRIEEPAEMSPAEESAEIAAADAEEMLVPPEDDVALEPPEDESTFGGESASDEEDPFAAMGEAPAEPEAAAPEAVDEEDAFAVEEGAPAEEPAEPEEEIGLAGGEEMPSLADEAVQMAESVAGEGLGGDELSAGEEEISLAGGEEGEAVAAEEEPIGMADEADEPVAMAEESEEPVAVDESDAEPIVAADEEPVAAAEEPGPVEKSEAPFSVSEEEAGAPTMSAMFAHDDAQYLEGLDEPVGLGDEEIVDAEDFLRGVQDTEEVEVVSEERYGRLSTKDDVESAIAEAERLAAEAGEGPTIVTRSAASEIPASVLPQGEGAIGRVSDAQIKEVHRAPLEKAEAFIDIAGDDEIQQALSDAGDVVMVAVDPSEKPVQPSGNFAVSVPEPEPADDEPIGIGDEDEAIGLAEDSEAPVVAAAETADEPVAMADDEREASAEAAAAEAADEREWLPFTKEHSDALKLAAKNAGVIKKLSDRMVFDLKIGVRFPDGEEAFGVLCLYDKRPALMQDESGTPQNLTRECFIAYL